MCGAFPEWRGVLACPKTELERNVPKWLWWHPSAYGFVGNYRGTAAATPSTAARAAGTVPTGGCRRRRPRVAGFSRTMVVNAPSRSGAVLIGNEWVIAKETRGKDA